MTIPNKPGYSHGSTGTEPSSPIDYQNGDPVDESEFDYFIYTPFNKIKELIDFLEEVDSNGDGKVDAAEAADSAASVDGADVDGQVSSAQSANVADQAKRFEVRTNDPPNPDDGQVWIRSDL